MMRWRLSILRCARALLTLVLFVLVVPLSQTNVTLQTAADAPNETCELTWSPVDTPEQYERTIGVVNSNDVWAVGSSIMHWDGATWKIVQDDTDNSSLVDISVLSAVDIWAAGWKTDANS